MTHQSFEDPREFDDWAATYDRDVHGRDDFPFLGYEAVLDSVVAAAAPHVPCAVLDLGIGTGNLARRFAERGCDVWGLDFSAKMLALAAAKVPGARLARADIQGAWPASFVRRFDIVTSAYAFHHFPLERKIDLLRRIRGRDGMGAGRIVIADLSFPDARALSLARAKWSSVWDEEFYWVADEALPACEAAGFQARYDQVSEVAGRYVLTPLPTPGSTRKGQPT